MTAIAAAVETPRALRRQELWVVNGGLLFVVLLAALNATIVGGPRVLDHLAWTVIACLLAETIATPRYGTLGDLYGRKVIVLSASEARPKT